MRGKTHIAVGVAAAVVAMRPELPVDCLIAVLGGAVGGIVCDLDEPSSTISQDFRHVRRLLLAVVAGVFALDLIWNAGLWQTIVARLTTLLAAGTEEQLRALAGLAIALLTCSFGSRTPHRTFMHSALALILLGAAAEFLFAPLAQPFVIGFVSHLALDLLNHQPERLLWPLPQGFSLGLVCSDGKANAPMVAASIAAIALVVAPMLGLA